MTKRHTYRPIPLALTFLIATISAVVALAVSGGQQAHAHESAGQAATHAVANRKGMSKAEYALRTDMRRLWEDHITWTRLAVISLIDGSPDTTATVDRLLRNQVDIGSAIEPFYGTNAGAELTRLLTEHITVAADLIAAAKAGDQAAVATTQSSWEDNADRIAAFLSKANPRSWKLDETKAMLHDHLRLTTDEVVARLQSDWAADVRAYDEIHRQALHMADMLSSGIVAQFPKRFR